MPDAAETPRPRLALIAAVARNGAIGRDNRLLFRDGEDMRRFRETTLGAAVIMGRRTWDSLPPASRPLPGRRNIVLTRNAAWRAEGAEAVCSFEQALARAASPPAGTAPADAAAAATTVFVIGGAEVYAMALPHADELRLTEVDADLDGDVFFPTWDRRQFRQVAAQPMRSEEGVGYRFVTYRRLPR